MSPETALTKIAAFKGKQIRKVFHNNEWWFSVADVVNVLTESLDTGAYWRKLKQRLSEEGSEVVTKCHGLKLLAPDGKMRETDCADTEGIFRIIQSIPSPNAEPFKLWLARVGYERVEEAVDPELAIQRAIAYYLKKGYSQHWINMRLKSIEIRKLLTDEWVTRGVKSSDESATLTDDITFAWAGMTTKQYKQFKELKKENLRDNMTNLELVLNMLAEASTTEISEVKQPQTFKENRKVAKQGGAVAGKARKAIESKTGKKVITRDSYIKQQLNKDLK